MLLSFRSKVAESQPRAKSVAGRVSLLAALFHGDNHHRSGRGGPDRRGQVFAHGGHDLALGESPARDSFDGHRAGEVAAGGAVDKQDRGAVSPDTKTVRTSPTAKDVAAAREIRPAIMARGRGVCMAFVSCIMSRKGR